ncbi:hypothetical protein G6F31_018512 [Rhizopus arrhizus]|nr:hypothetical protein G6F31_018512 [Rhizopus arrhizus]
MKEIGSAGRWPATSGCLEYRNCRPPALPLQLALQGGIEGDRPVPVLIAGDDGVTQYPCCGVRRQRIAGSRIGNFANGSHPFLPVYRPLAALALIGARGKARYNDCLIQPGKFLHRSQDNARLRSAVHAPPPLAFSRRRPLREARQQRPVIDLVVMVVREHQRGVCRTE